MSTTSTNYAELNVTNDDLKEVLAEGPEDPVAAEAAPKKKRNALYRILALLLAAAPIVCLCLLKVKLLSVPLRDMRSMAKRLSSTPSSRSSKRTGSPISIRRSRALPPISGRINLWASPSSPRVRSASS